MNGVKETLCTRCYHRNVCKYTEQFLAVQKKLDEVEFAISGTDEVRLAKLRDIPWLEADLKCQYYRNLLEEEVAL